MTQFLPQGRLLLTLAAPFFLLNISSLVGWAKNKSLEGSELKLAIDLNEVKEVDAHICTLHVDSSDCLWHLAFVSPTFQVWKTQNWTRLVPEGILHVNWDPFRPRRSQSYVSSRFQCLPLLLLQQCKI